MTETPVSGGTDKYGYLPEPTLLADTITTLSSDAGRPPAVFFPIGDAAAGNGPAGEGGGDGD